MIFAVNACPFWMFVGGCSSFSASPVNAGSTYATCGRLPLAASSSSWFCESSGFICTVLVASLPRT
jgi:hypothetical protein